MDGALQRRWLGIEHQVDVGGEAHEAMGDDREPAHHEVAGLGLIQRPHDRLDAPSLHDAPS